MENQPISPAMPVTPPVMPSVPEKPHTRWPLLLVVSLILLGAYAAFAYSQSLWPFPPAPTPSPTASVTPNPTASWQTYTDTQYGFQIKYPTGWEIVKNPNYYGGGIVPSGETPYAINYGPAPQSADQVHAAIFYVGKNNQGPYTYKSTYGLFGISSNNPDYQLKVTADQIFSTFTLTK